MTVLPREVEIERSAEHIILAIRKTKKDDRLIMWDVDNQYVLDRTKNLVEELCEKFK